MTEYTVNRNVSTSFMVEAETPEAAIALVKSDNPPSVAHQENFMASPRQGTTVKSPALAASGKPSSAQ